MDLIVTFSAIAVMGGLALFAILRQRARTKRLEPFTRRRPGQEQALRICAEVFSMPELARQRVLWRSDVDEHGSFPTGYEVGRVTEFFKFGWAHVRVLPGDAPMDLLLRLAHVCGHLYCQKGKLGPEPPVFGWWRDMGHTLRLVWGDDGLVQRAQNRIRAEVSFSPEVTA